MHLDICKSCGGELERRGNHYICKFCGNKWMIDADSDVHVIDRANAWSALRDCDFEKATELFENIIFKEPENHEAYWGRALAKASIIYVTDLDERKRVPTCNNISENSFIDNSDVKKAISLAPVEIAEGYKEQAKRIEAIRIEWLEKASCEPEYDIFICFKDSDKERGLKRTPDSLSAHNLYNVLTAAGYRVFFSRESLKNKTSEHYEPYIYNAIKTAKVMIVYGERPEYFSAVWVKNEWTRFRDMIKAGKKNKNSLIVVYKDISTESLPAGLSNIQCLDAGEITFLETLKLNIQSIIIDDKKKLTDNHDLLYKDLLAKFDLIWGTASTSELTEEFKKILNVTENAKETIASIFEYDIFNQNQCDFLMQALKFYPQGKILEIDSQILTAANAMIQKGFFESANQLIDNISKRGGKNPKIYWLLCLVKIGAAGESQINDCDTPIESLYEYKQYISLVDERERKICSEIANEQKKNILLRQEKEKENLNRKNKKKKKVIKVIKGTIICLLIIMVSFGAYIGYSVFSENKIISEIEARIENLPADESLYIECHEEIVNTYSAYMELDDRLREKVGNADRLISVMDGLEAAYIASDIKKIADIEALIDSLPSDENLYLDYQAEIFDTYSAYMELDEALKKRVGNYDKLATIIDSLEASEGYKNMQSIQFTKLESGGYSVKLKEGANLSISGELIIPSQYCKEPVVVIEENAFKNCFYITSVIVPNSVQTINRGAFMGCSKIENITLPFTGNTRNAIGFYAVFGWIFGYEYQQNHVTGSASEDFVNSQYGSSSVGVWQFTRMNRAHNGTNSDSKQSFYYFIPDSIKNVTVTDQTVIKDATFNGCTMLETITYKKGISSQGQYALQNCTATLIDETN